MNTFIFACCLGVTAHCEQQGSRSPQSPVQGPIHDNVEKLIAAGDRWVAQGEAWVSKADARISDIETQTAAALADVQAKITWAYSVLIGAILGHRPMSGALSWMVTRKK